MSRDIIDTKVTKLGTGLYGCRVFRTDTRSVICEMRVRKDMISTAMKYMLRTLDKLGYDSRMCSSSRHRDKNWNFSQLDSGIIWYRSGEITV